MLLNNGQIEKTVTTKKLTRSSRIRLIITCNDADPRIFEVITHAPIWVLAEAISEGAKAFNKAFVQSLERARSASSPEQLQQLRTQKHAKDSNIRQGIAECYRIFSRKDRMHGSTGTRC